MSGEDGLEASFPASGAIPEGAASYALVQRPGEADLLGLPIGAQEQVFHEELKAAGAV